MRKFIVILIALSALSCTLVQVAPAPVAQRNTATPRPTFAVNPTVTPLPSTATPIPPTVTPLPSDTAIPATPTPSLYTEARVVKVVDGDTIDVAIGGQTYAVRYIGIDAPESKKPNTPVQLGSLEAAARNEQLVGGQTVRLEKDVSETDRYGRLLRYVWVGDQMVNEILVREGFAWAKSYPPDTKYQSRFSSCQEQARAVPCGLWLEPAPKATLPAVVPKAIQPTLAPAQASAGCDRCIKGNINDKKEKIYHLPNCPYYSRTKIDESKGERWFSSEAEAQAAGWRRALNCP